MLNQQIKKICLFYLGTILLYAACQKNPVPPDEMPLRNPREYTWTVDTLYYPNSFQTLMDNIWASSADNVYLAGHNARGVGKMYHYDGRQWDDVKLATSQGGNISGPIDLRAIHGFAPDDIWAVGERLGINPDPPPNFLDSSLVIHYDGSWLEFNEPIFDTGRILLAIWGTSSSNLWVGGVDATLFHYDGIQWQKLTSPVASKPSFPANIRSITGTPSGDKVYMLIRADDFNKSPQQEYYHFVQYANEAFTIVDSDSVVPGHIEHKFGYDELWYSPWNVLYSVGNAGLFEWTGGHWSLIRNFGVQMEKVYGTSTDNIFVVGHFGQVWHYNGSDWYQFKEFEPTGLLFRAVWTDGHEAFIIGSTGRETIVLHGK